HALLERPNIAVRRLPWLSSAMLYLLLTTPWFIMVAMRNAGFLDFFFVHEHLQRYAESTEHRQGVWFFFAVVLVGFWPWIALVPFCRSESAAAAPRSATRFLLVWFIVVFVFFSIPSSKLGSYILPAFPPLAILAAWGAMKIV